MGRENPTAGYRELGAAMRKLRLAAGMTGLQVGHRTGWTPSQISRMESGKVNIDVAKLCWYLGVLRVPHDQAVPLINLCRLARSNPGYWVTAHGDRIPDAFGSLLYHESTANLAASYESQVIPGLLQTERYARTLIGGNITYTEEAAESGVKIRMERQWVRDRRDCSFIFYIHEQALRTAVGDDGVMAEQMLALTLGGNTPNVKVRVISGPIGDHPTLMSPFQVYDFAEHPPLVHLNNNTGASFWFEDPDFVAPYSKLLLHLAEVSATVEESREFIAALADEYDRRSSTDGLHLVEEEQL